MKECDNSTRKIHIRSNFILPISLLIMLDTLLLRPSLHCNTSLHFTTLHPTTLHYTSPHFTTLHPITLHYTYRRFISSHIHFTTLSFSFTHLHHLYIKLLVVVTPVTLGNEILHLIYYLPMTQMIHFNPETDAADL